MSNVRCVYAGFVYEAMWNGITVAAKVITVGADVDDVHLERFKSEAQICMTLRHPFIVTTYTAMVLRNDEGRSKGHTVVRSPGNWAIFGSVDGRIVTICFWCDSNRWRRSSDA